MNPQGAGFQRRSVNVQVLPSASNVVITGGSFTGVQQNNTGEGIHGRMSALRQFMLTQWVNPHFGDFSERLYAHVAPNAILNAGGRADEVRCYPGTREAVIGIIEKWIGGGDDVSRPIFWLSGPAGGGKSAIMQTIAERCIQRNAPMANYFFFRADSSRNHAGSVVATLLYQMLELYPTLKEKITILLNAKPLIFKQSIRDQFKYLIDNPVRAILHNSAQKHRLLLLFDGLDECSPETKHIQRDLLRVLHDLSSHQGSPFMVLVASRAEPHLVMAFNEIGTSNDSIFLDESYQPSEDIRVFVAAEFDVIKRNHHLRQTLDDDWPSKARINEIVAKSSGQFIYAATVMRFISSSSASPKHSLDKVRGIRPIVKNSPFAELDAIYSHILSRTEDWKSAKDILAGQLILSMVEASSSKGIGGHEYPIRTLLAPLGVGQSDIESYLSDLVAVVQYDSETKHVAFYHASLRDFLCDKSRSNALYIDIELFTARLATAHIRLPMSSIEDAELFCFIFSLLKIATPPLRDALTSWKPWRAHTRYMEEPGVPKWASINRIRTSGPRCINALQTLYYEDDNLFYQIMLQKWLTWFYDLDIHMEEYIYDPRTTNPEARKIWDDNILRSITRETKIIHPEGSKIRDDTQESRTGETALPKKGFWKRVLSKVRLSMRR